MGSFEIPSEVTGVIVNGIVAIVIIGYLKNLFSVFIPTVLPMIISGVLAEKKGKSVGLWIFLGFLIGWIAVIIVALKASEKQDNNSYNNSTNIEDVNNQSNFSKSFKAVNTNQLYSKKVDNASRWTCSCGEKNHPNAIMCIYCGKGRNQ